MGVKRRSWRYYDTTAGDWSAPISRDELDELFDTGVIDENTLVVDLKWPQPPGTPFTGVPYSQVGHINVTFSPSIEDFLSSRSNKISTVLSGPNNSGKTLLLKQLYARVGHDGLFVACNRFSHVDVLNTRHRDAREHFRYFDNFLRSFQLARQNTEDSELRLEQVITSLKDADREKLFSIAFELLGNRFTLSRTEPENSFSPFFIDMDGQNLRYGSSGTRLLLTLLGILLDNRFGVLFIDEPELGLSPRIQAALARCLYDGDVRSKMFPHLRQVFIATHSSLFLDRTTLSNNFIVTKLNEDILIEPTQTIGEFNHLQINMLGNELESLFLPSAIVIVEGESDLSFISKITQLHLPTRKVAVIRAGGDGGIQDRLHILNETFGDLNTSPYRERLFVVLDSKHSVKSQRLEKQGVLQSNIISWNKNGIEYLYPIKILSTIFACSESEVRAANLEHDPIEINGIRKSKKELGVLVADKMTLSTLLEPELCQFLDKIRQVCG